MYAAELPRSVADHKRRQQAFHYIPLGLQCSVPEGIARAGRRYQSYAFDFNWCPAECALTVVKLLTTTTTTPQQMDAAAERCNAALDYLTSDLRYHHMFVESDYVAARDGEVTDKQINASNGFGVIHFDGASREFRDKLLVRIYRLYCDIVVEDDEKDRRRIFIFADTRGPLCKYTVDGDDRFSADATPHLTELLSILHRYNPHARLWYFCWSQRYQQHAAAAAAAAATKTPPPQIEYFALPDSPVSEGIVPAGIAISTAIAEHESRWCNEGIVAAGTAIAEHESRRR